MGFDTTSQVFISNQHIWALFTNGFNIIRRVNRSNMSIHTDLILPLTKMKVAFTPDFSMFVAWSEYTQVFIYDSSSLSLVHTYIGSVIISKDQT